MSESKSIFQLSEEFRQLELLLEESGGEITEELEAALQITQDALTQKGEGYAMLIRKALAEADMAKKERDRIDKLIKSRENKAEFWKARIKAAMELYAIKRISTVTGSITLAEREGTPDIIDASLIPAKFKELRQETVILKNEINKAVKDGEVVPGVEKGLPTKYILIK